MSVDIERTLIYAHDRKSLVLDHLTVPGDKLEIYTQDDGGMMIVSREYVHTPFNSPPVYSGHTLFLGRDAVVAIHKALVTIDDAKKLAADIADLTGRKLRRE